MSEKYTMSQDFRSQLVAFDARLVGFITLEPFMDIVEEKLNNYDPADDETATELTGLFTALRNEMHSLRSNNLPIPEELNFLDAALRETLVTLPTSTV